jgi:hypothetical protein
MWSGALALQLGVDAIAADVPPDDVAGTRAAARGEMPSESVS